MLSNKNTGKLILAHTFRMPMSSHVVGIIWGTVRSPADLSCLVLHSERVISDFSLVWKLVASYCLLAVLSHHPSRLPRYIKNTSASQRRGIYFVSEEIFLSCLFLVQFIPINRIQSWRVGGLCSEKKKSNEVIFFRRRERSRERDHSRSREKSRRHKSRSRDRHDDYYRERSRERERHRDRDRDRDRERDREREYRHR